MSPGSTTTRVQQTGLETEVKIHVNSSIGELGVFWAVDSESIGVVFSLKQRKLMDNSIL